MIFTMITLIFYTQHLANFSALVWLLYVDSSRRNLAMFILPKPHNHDCRFSLCLTRSMFLSWQAYGRLRSVPLVRIFMQSLSNILLCSMVSRELWIRFVDYLSWKCYQGEGCQHLRGIYIKCQSKFKPFFVVVENLCVSWQGTKVGFWR